MAINSDNFISFQLFFLEYSNVVYNSAQVLAYVIMSNIL